MAVAAVESVGFLSSYKNNKKLTACIKVVAERRLHASRWLQREKTACIKVVVEREDCMHQGGCRERRLHEGGCRERRLHEGGCRERRLHASRWL